MIIWYVHTKSTHYLNRASVGARVHWRLHVRVWKRLCAMDPAHARVCVCVWLGFKIVSRACVINVPEREGHERYITGGGRAEKVQQGGKGGREKDRLVRKKREEVVEWGGLVSPGSCYVSHYVSHGHWQYASRQNKRVSLAWHGSYFPILGTGSERGQAAGWGAGGIVGSGLASKT